METWGRLDGGLLQKEHEMAGLKVGEVGPAGSGAEATFRKVMGYAILSPFSARIRHLSQRTLQANRSQLVGAGLEDADLTDRIEPITEVTAFSLTRGQETSPRIGCASTP